MIAEIDTEAHCVYFVRKILSHVVVFCCFCMNLVLKYAKIVPFFQLKHHKTKKTKNCITTKFFCQNEDNYPSLSIPAPYKVSWL